MGEGVPVAAKIVIAVVVVAVGLIVILVPMSFSALEYYEVSEALPGGYQSCSLVPLK